MISKGSVGARCVAEAIAGDASRVPEKQETRFEKQLRSKNHDLWMR